MDAQEIQRMIESANYDYYGIRVVSEHNDDIRVAVGQVLGPSSMWVDGDPTDDELPGTCAISVTKGITKALAQAARYTGYQVALIASDRMTWGEDPLEIILRDARVLAVWERGEVRA